MNLINDVTHDNGVSILFNDVIDNDHVINLVQRMKTRFKDINTWFKKWRWNQRKSKCKEKK